MIIELTNTIFTLPKKLLTIEKSLVMCVLNKCIQELEALI